MTALINMISRIGQRRLLVLAILVTAVVTGALVLTN